MQLYWLCHLVQSDMLNVYHFPANYLFLSTCLFQLCVSFRYCLSCNRVWSPSDFLFLMWLLPMMPCPIVGPFYFQGSGVLISCHGTWSGSICKEHIAWQELQALALILCKMAFQLNKKLVVLHLDNSTLKLIYVIKVVEFLFFFSD